VSPSGPSTYYNRRINLTLGLCFSKVRGEEGRREGRGGGKGVIIVYGIVEMEW
jgi:hypothetical protein